jgi:glucosylceramidase
MKIFLNVPVKLTCIATITCLLLVGCSIDKKTTGSENEVSRWMTKADKSLLLQKQPDSMAFGSEPNRFLTIDVDSAVRYQAVDGFGYSLTGGSAMLINKLSAAQRTSLLQELFGKGENSISVSYLRISIGASDLDASVFSYNDLPAGQTDANLTKFSISPDEVDLIPLLKEIIAINPDIKIMGSPWSAPVWMKDNHNSVGGSLLPEFYSSYANYFVKYIQAMKSHGVTVNAITPQNEPLHGGNNPSMIMTPQQQAEFIKTNLGPAFRDAGITTKIIIYDHNCDKPDYPITVLNDAGARQFIDGSAFHLYAGDVNALSTVHNAYPEKNLYFTEQWTGAKDSFDGDLKWHTKNVIIGTMRNWSRIALEWNLANNSKYEPHTPGGCTECKGALTVENGGITRNESYYIIGQVSKFVPPGSIRIESKGPVELDNVAFITPEGKKVLLVLNEGVNPVSFNIRFKAQTAVTSIPAGTVCTYIW